jgi:hypothetical protein
MTEGDRLPLAIAVHVPTLAVRVAAGFVRFLAARRSGVRAFRTALVAGGMRPDLADRLARLYHDTGSIAKILRNAATLGMR